MYKDDLTPLVISVIIYFHTVFSFSLRVYVLIPRFGKILNIFLKEYEGLFRILDNLILF